MDVGKSCIICNDSLQVEFEDFHEIKEDEVKILIEKSKESADDFWKHWSGKSVLYLHNQCKLNYLDKSPQPKRRKLLSPESVFEVPYETTTSISTTSATVNPGSSETITTTSTTLTYNVQPVIRTSIRNEASTPTSETGTSEEPENCSFDFSEFCVFCSNKLDRKHKKVRSFSSKTTEEIIVNNIRDSQDKDIEKIIRKVRLAFSSNCNQLSYHEQCYKHLSKKTAGPSKHTVMVKQCFQNLYDYIETSGKFEFSLDELKKALEPHSCYNETLFKHLRDRFNDEILIIQKSGTQPVVYYKTVNLSAVATDFCTEENSLSELQKETILTIAGRILKKEIMKEKYSTTSYSYSSDLAETTRNCIPPLLHVFLREALDITNKDNIDRKNNQKNKIKERRARLNTIALSMISFLQPPSFTSMQQLSVATYIFRKTGSRLIIDLLSKLGVSSSYYQLRKFEESVIMDPPTMVISSDVDKVFVMFVFDNTDHNVATLDGKNTFHCLGGIAIYIPGYGIIFNGETKKFKGKLKASDLANAKAIALQYPKDSTKQAFHDTVFEDVNSLIPGEEMPVPEAYGLYLWGKTVKLPIATWKGFFETIYSDDTSFSTCYIEYLPFINAPPSQPMTINSALYYAKNETKRLKQRTCFSTFDQPLFHKARALVSQDEELKDVEVILGDFHTDMSFMGCEGYIMEGSGLEELWATVYAKDSIKQMMSGHAYARALRAHILTFTSLGIIICKTIKIQVTDIIHISDLFTKEKNTSYDRHNSADDNNVENFSENVTIGEINADPVIKRLTNLFNDELQRLEKLSDTAKLWVQYFKTIKTLLQHIEAQRIGNWRLKLSSLKDMLPIFHAAGRYAYAKSAQMFVQDMATLEERMDHEEFIQYTRQGGFTVRRSDKPWSGVATDQVIEQTLNRFFGTNLTHGRGVEASVVARYLIPMPAIVRMMENLEEYLNLHQHTSEQHIDLSNSRMDKDNMDIDKFLFWFEQHNPFPSDCSVMSLSTGLIGDSKINCHLAVETGLESMKTMIGKTFPEISLTKLFKVKPLSVVAGTVHMLDDNCVKIDSQVLLQRLTVVFKAKKDLEKEAFSYELCTIPASLFDDSGIMRKSPKAELYKYFFTCQPIKDPDFYHVLDGGWLLHKFVWPHSTTYQGIFEGYFQFITRRYGKNVTVVFDGYNNELIGTKSYERYRRNNTSTAADVSIAKDNLVTLKQAQFLSNVANKWKFVQLLSEYLKDHGIQAKIAEEDADCLIVRTAIECKEKEKQEVAIVGNDVDLLILAIALTPDNVNVYFKKDMPGQKPFQLYATDDHLNHKPYILFAHSFAGCDTTSAFLGIGKKSILKLLSNPGNQLLAQVFYESNQDIDVLYNAAEKFVLQLYSSKKSDEKIADFRYKLYCKLVRTSKKKFQLSSLPPTKSALLQHVKRVYYQIQSWLGMNLNPEDWGWRRTQFILVPIMMEEPAVPSKLLTQVHCGCTTNCSSNRCSCKKAGMKCTEACKFCNGESCDNCDISNKISEPEEQQFYDNSKEDANYEEEEEDEEEEGWHVSAPVLDTNPLQCLFETDEQEEDEE